MTKVFILQWNPVISNCSEDDFAKTVTDGSQQFGWELCDWESVSKGDLVYMVKNRPAPDAGIVLQGRVKSCAFPGPHWSGRGKSTHYVWIDVEYIINHDECPILSLDALEETMPGFQWDGGHSGRELPVKESFILEKMWFDYLDIHKDYFDGLRARSKKRM